MSKRHLLYNLQEANYIISRKQTSTFNLSYIKFMHTPTLRYFIGAFISHMIRSFSVNPNSLVVTILATTRSSNRDSKLGHFYHKIKNSQFF